MKTLEVILRKRKALQGELKEFKERLPIVPRPFAENYKLLTAEEKREYGYVMSVIRDLTTQIDALTYVINYDSEMKDAQRGFYYRRDDC